MEKRRTLKDLEAEIARLRRLAYTDELTGLYNRHGFKELAGIFMQEVTSARKGRRESVVIRDLSVLLFDLDHFKKVNDTHGHDGGDKVLSTCASLIKKSVRDIDVPARWGGEEFVLALVGATEDDAMRIAEGLRQSIEKARITFDGKRIPMTTSVGLASAGDATDLAELVARADKALYASKHGGRNRVTRWSDL